MSKRLYMTLENGDVYSVSYTNTADTYFLYNGINGKRVAKFEYPDGGSYSPTYPSDFKLADMKSNFKPKFEYRADDAKLHTRTDKIKQPKKPTDCEYVVFRVYAPAYSNSMELAYDSYDFEEFDNKADCDKHIKEHRLNNMVTAVKLEVYTWNKDKSDINDAIDYCFVGKTYTEANKEMKKCLGNVKIWDVDRDGWYV